MVKKILPFAGQKWNVSKKESENKVKNRLNWQFKAFISIILIIVILVVVLIPVYVLEIWRSSSAKTYWLPDYDSNSKLGEYSSAAVSTDATPCAPIGRDILAKNGSAVDAAVAVLICMGVVNPHSMGLGGGVLMMVYKRDQGISYFFDAREKAPLKATENMYNGSSALSKIGALSIAVPGELAGYAEVHKRFGSLPWKDLFQPTIEMCRTGIEVNMHLAKALKQNADTIKQNEAMRNIFVNNITNEVFQKGDKILRPDFEETLRTIAKDGRNALYDPSHPLAQKFLKDLKDMGSIIDENDMLQYTVTRDPPLRVTLRDNVTLFSVPAPGSGALLSLMMNILDGYNLSKNITKSRTESVLTLHRIVEAFKFAYAMRMELEDQRTEPISDQHRIEKLINDLTSKEYAAAIRAKIDDTKTYHDPEHYGLKNSTFEEDHGTASMAVVAPNGDAVVATSTINLYFGSREISKSTGIILNDEMDDFSLPHVESYFLVPPSKYNRIKPGKRPMSSMCPTIGIDSNGNVKLAISGNGGTKITSAVLQVALRNLWLDENIKKSIDAPRFHHQLLPDYIEYEKEFPMDLLKELEKKGHSLHDLSGMSGIVVAIARDEVSHKLYANSDYRKGGNVAGY